MSQKFLSKKNLYTILTIIILIVAAVFLYKAITLTGLDIVPIINNQNPANKTTNNSGSTNATTPTASLSYQEALKIYADKRIQFSINYNGACVAVPIHSVFKNGTKIMLDNRSEKTLTISLDGAVSNIAGYGFKIVTLSTKSPLPHTLKINCNGSKGVSQLILQ